MTPHCKNCIHLQGETEGAYECTAEPHYPLRTHPDNRCIIKKQFKPKPE